MFTGIVEETGKILSLSRFSTGAQIEISCEKILEGTIIGDSICVNGVCQTVTEIGKNYFRAKLSDETLAVTNFKQAKSGDYVNLERALTLNSRLGGHIVSGHIDCCAKLEKIDKLDEFYNMTFMIDNGFEKYLVRKGSVTVDGISLTLAEVDGRSFKVAVIPHTFENTVLKHKQLGSFVNIETDILAKYVEKLLSVDDNKSKIDMELLVKNGFV